MTLQERLDLELEKRSLRAKYNIPEGYDIITEEEYAAREAKDSTAIGVFGERAALGAAPGAAAFGATAIAQKAFKNWQPKGLKGKLVKGGIEYGVAPIVAAAATAIGQHEVEEAIRGEEDQREVDLRRQAELSERPFSGIAGEMISGGLASGVKPSTKNLVGLKDAVKSGFGLRAKPSEAAKYAAGQAGIGGGLGIAFETGRQVVEDDFSVGGLAAAGLTGAAFTEPFLHGKLVYGPGAPPISDPPPRDPQFAFADPEDAQKLTPLSPEQALLARGTFKSDPTITQYTREGLTDIRINELEKLNAKNSKLDSKAKELREHESGPGDSVEVEYKETLADSDKLEQVKIDDALEKAFNKKLKPTKTKKKVALTKAAITKKAKSEIAKLTDEQVAHRYAKLEKVKRSKLAHQYLDKQNLTTTQARESLVKEIEAKLPIDTYESVRSLVDKRGVTMQVAVNRLVDNATVLAGFAPRKGGMTGTRRDIVLSLEDLTPDAPMHETAHVFIRDMIQSSNETDSKLARGWLGDVLKNDPSFDLKAEKAKYKKRGYKFDSDREFFEEFLVTEGSKKLEKRLRELPAGKFDKMRRWFSDVRRGNKVKYGKAAVSDILDYMAQRLELDPNQTFDSDLWRENEVEYLKFLADSPAKIVDVKSSDSHTATKTFNGVEYKSTVEAYDVPKEVEELLDLPKRPKEFTKEYANSLNDYKIALDNKQKFGSRLSYLDEHSITEENFDQFMDIMRGRNSGMLKKLYKSLDTKPEIILKTRRPEEPAGYFEHDQIIIGIPTIDEAFDTTVARYLLYSRMAESVQTDKTIGSVWATLFKSHAWVKDYEPYMVHRFLDYAIRASNKVDEATIAKLKYYHDHLKVEPLSGDHASNRSKLVDYDTLMMHQGDALQGILKNIPDDVRREFAYRTANVDGLGLSVDEHIQLVDQMLDVYGIAGSSTRKNFEGLTEGNIGVLQGLLTTKNFDLIDNAIAGFEKIKNNIPFDESVNNLQDLFSMGRVPANEVTPDGMRKAFVDLAERVTGVKGVDPLIQNNPTPPKPKQSEFDDFRLASKIVGEDSGTDPIGRIDDDTPIPTDSTPKDGSWWSNNVVSRVDDFRYGEMPRLNVTDAKSWRPIRRMLRQFRPAIDRIREIGFTADQKELTGYIATKLETVAVEERTIVGKFLERTMLAFSEVNMTADELNGLGNYQTQRWHQHLGLIDDIDENLKNLYNNNSRVRYYDRMIESVLRDTRTMQNDLGLKVAVYRGGEPEYVAGQHTFEYTPEIINQTKRRILMKSRTQSKEYQDTKAELIAYWKKISKDDTEAEIVDAIKQFEEAGEIDGKPMEKIEANLEASREEKFDILFENFAGALRANDKEIGSHKFKALRVSTGKLGLPADWVESNAVQRMTRYVVRFAKDMAMFKHIESDPKSRQILGLPDQEGNFIIENDLPGMENGGPFNVKGLPKGESKTAKEARDNAKVRNKPLYSSEEIESVMENYIGYYENMDLWTRTFNRAITSMWLGFGAGTRDFLSSYLFALPYMRTQDLHVLASQFLSFKEMWVKSYEYGVNSTNYNNIEFRAEGISQVCDGVNAAADLALRVGGRNILERSTRAMQMAFGKQLISSALRFRPLERIPGFKDWTARRLISTVQKQMGDISVDGKKVNLEEYAGKIPPDEILDRAAAAWVEINQGTYDARGLPTFTQRGVLSMVTSLSRWSIEKSDRMNKDILMPLITERDPLPLVKALFAGVVGGEGIRYISEVIANKMQTDPKIIESIHMEDEKELSYSLLNAIQYAGFFGFQSALIFDLVKAGRFGMNDGIPGGFTFPIVDAATSIGNKFTKFFSSGEWKGESFATQWMKFLRDVFTDLNQSGRYAANHLLLSKDMSEFNARSSLRKWERLTTGVDRQIAGTDLGNPYMWPAREQFKKADSIADARAILPKAVREAAKEAMQKHPDNLVEQQVRFKRNLDTLWQVNWKSTPALPSQQTRADYVRQKNRMQYLGIKPSKGELARFPDLATINRRESGAAKTKIFGTRMMPGTVITKEQAKGLIKTEKQFEKLKADKKKLLMRYVGSKGQLL